MQSLESEALTRRELFSALEMPTQTEKRKKKRKERKIILIIMQGLVEVLY